MPVAWLWSRRLTEPPRPANVGLRPSIKMSEPKGWRGRSESCQTGSVHRLAPAGTKSPMLQRSRRLCQPPRPQPSNMEPRSSRRGILYKRKNYSNPSYSSGEGVWGRGASLREAASPPEYPHFPSFCNFGLDKLHLRAIMQRIQQGRCEVTLAVSFSLFCWYSAGSCAILAGL